MKYCLLLACVALFTTKLNAAQHKLDLLSKARSASTVRVIIDYDAAVPNLNGNPNPNLSAKSQLKGQSLESAKLLAKKQAKQGILQGLEGTPYKQLKSFDRLKQMVVEVDEAGLRKLLDDPTITVHEDVLRRPLLAQSVSRIYPTQSTSSFHGNNNWAVAILDSGVDKSHPTLSGKVVSEACYSDGGGQPGTTSLCPGGAISSVATGSGDACSASVTGCEHGTYLAGIAAGRGGLANGVAKDANIISIQVYSRVDDVDFCFPDASCIAAYASDVIAGLQRVYDLRNAHSIAAVNLSLGSGLNTGTCDSQPEKPIIDQLKSAGILTVVASGNDGSTSQISAPACISSALAVGSSLDTSDVRSTYSNNSVALDLYAPGEPITSARLGGGYITGSGTSGAAAHVSGALAVIRHMNPTANASNLESLLKSHGPNISAGGVTRKRIDVSSILGQEVMGVVPMGAIMLLLLDD